MFDEVEELHTKKAVSHSFDLIGADQSILHPERGAAPDVASALPQAGPSGTVARRDLQHVRWSAVHCDPRAGFKTNPLRKRGRFHAGHPDALAHAAGYLPCFETASSRDVVAADGRCSGDSRSRIAGRIAVARQSFGVGGVGPRTVAAEPRQPAKGRTELRAPGHS